MNLDDLSPKHRAEALSQLRKIEKVPFKAPEPMTIQPTTDEAKLNKTERAYLEWLRSTGLFQWIGVQNVTLKLGDDTRYTCDFFAMTYDGEMTGREVKGFFRDDAKVKIKVAARMFPWIKFSVVKKDGSGWDHKEVKP